MLNPPSHSLLSLIPPSPQVIRASRGHLVPAWTTSREAWGTPAPQGSMGSLDPKVKEGHTLLHYKHVHTHTQTHLHTQEYNLPY